MECSLYAVRVFVTDWERAIRYYTETLGIPLVASDPDHGWAELATGPGRLAIERVDDDDEHGRALVGRFVGASLRVADVERDYAALSKRGVDFVGPPAAQSWGGTLAHVRDPEGNVITLVSGLADA